MFVTHRASKLLRNTTFILQMSVQMCFPLIFATATVRTVPAFHHRLSWICKLLRPYSTDEKHRCKNISANLRHNIRQQLHTANTNIQQILEEGRGWSTSCNENVVLHSTRYVFLHHITNNEIKQTKQICIILKRKFKQFYALKYCELVNVRFEWILFRKRYNRIA